MQGFALKRLSILLDKLINLDIQARSPSTIASSRAVSRPYSAAMNASAASISSLVKKPSSTAAPHTYNRLLDNCDATRQRGRLRHPRRTPRKAMVLLRRLQGRLVGSPDQSRSAFSMQTVRAVLSRARALRAITRSAPARPRTRRAPRNQPIVDRIGPYGTCDIFELLLARQL